MFQFGQMFGVLNPNFIFLYSLSKEATFLTVQCNHVDQHLKLTCHLKINNQHTVILLVILLVKFYQVDWQKQMRTVWDISHTTNCQLWSHNVGTCRPGHTNNFESWLLKYTNGVICFANDTIPKGFIILNDEAISKCWGRGSSYKNSVNKFSCIADD